MPPRVLKNGKQTLPKASHSIISANAHRMITSFLRQSYTIYTSLKSDTVKDMNEISSEDLLVLFNMASKNAGLIPTVKFTSRDQALKRTFARFLEWEDQIDVMEKDYHDPNYHPRKPRFHISPKGNIMTAAQLAELNQNQTAEEAAQDPVATGIPAATGEGAVDNTPAPSADDPAAKTFIDQKFLPKSTTMTATKGDVNPRRPGSFGHVSMQLIIDAEKAGTPITIEQYLKTGGRRNDLQWDLEHGNVTTHVTEPLLKLTQTKTAEEKAKEAADKQKAKDDAAATKAADKLLQDKVKADAKAAADAKKAEAKAAKDAAKGAAAAAAAPTGEVAPVNEAGEPGADPLSSEAVT